MIEPFDDTLAEKSALSAQSDSTTLSDSNEASKRLGAYELLRLLGVGGMGKVYLARQTETQAQVALKILTKTNATRLYRFKREFRALVDVVHPNLVRLHELVIPAEGAPFLTMELLDGQPFVEWVRASLEPGEPPERGHLEHALRQLVEGVHHLHENGCVHRDIKPSNVFVTRDGRVVILDFGIVSELAEDRPGVTLEGQLLGTPSYMAPEQAAGLQVGRAADYYAIGVMLFEALTGALPYTGSPFALLLDKQHQPTIDLGDKLKHAPVELRHLCLRLLARDPDSRPGGEELLAALDLALPASSHCFVGRERELSVLLNVFSDARAKQASRVVHVSAPSGYGKSTLVRRFRALASEQGAVVLHGRCREQERLPFKGIDAVIDALSAYLRQLPPRAREALEPPDLDVLMRMFPVLHDIWAPAKQQDLGLVDLRKLGGVTLGKLLRSIGEQTPLVVHIDDVQWADLDSVALLAQISRLEAAPPWTLVLSFRSDEDVPEALAVLLADTLLSGPEVRRLELGPLSSTEARSLAEALLPQRGGLDTATRRARVEAIALRSHGNPFFISQLVGIERPPETDDSDLDTLVLERVAELEPGLQELLEIIVAFGGPVSRDLGLQLCNDTELGSASFEALARARLIVHGEIGDASEARVEVAHDRIREVVLGHIEASALARLHWRIGEALEGRSSELYELGAFELANHLNAGAPAVSPLSPERRVALARVNHHAAARALGASAYATARSYLVVAEEMLEYEYEAARSGKGEHELCVAVNFDRAQAELALASPAYDTIIEDLLTWHLSDEDYARVAHWHIEALGPRGKYKECVDFCQVALMRLGAPVPGRVSWFRALFSFAAGFVSLRRQDYRHLRAHYVGEGTVRGRTLEILSSTVVAALYVDPRLQLYLTGSYLRALARWGGHAGGTFGLLFVALVLARIGRGHEGKRLFEVARSLNTERDLSLSATFKNDTLVTSFSFVFEPPEVILSHGESAWTRTKEAAPPYVFSHVFGCVTLARFFVGVSLQAIERDVVHTCKHLLEKDFAVSHDAELIASLGDMGFEVLLAPLAMTRDLIHGTSLCEEVLLERARSLGIVELSTARFVACHVTFMLGRPHAAWALWREHSRHEERILGAAPQAGVVGLILALMTLDMMPALHGRARRRARASLRRHHATLRRFTYLCPSSFAPMLALLEGELAALRGEFEVAVGAFERSRKQAMEVENSWLLGLASERLADFGRRRGQELLANAAFEAALAAYEAWGARAVVARLIEDRDARLSSV